MMDVSGGAKRNSPRKAVFSQELSIRGGKIFYSLIVVFGLAILSGCYNSTIDTGAPHRNSSSSTSRDQPGSDGNLAECQLQADEASGGQRVKNPPCILKATGAIHLERFGGRAKADSGTEANPKVLSVTPKGTGGFPLGSDSTTNVLAELEAQLPAGWYSGLEYVSLAIPAGLNNPNHFTFGRKLFGRTGQLVGASGPSCSAVIDSLGFVQQACVASSGMKFSAPFNGRSLECPIDQSDFKYGHLETGSGTAHSSLSCWLPEQRKYLIETSSLPDCPLPHAGESRQLPSSCRNVGTSGPLYYMLSRFNGRDSNCSVDGDGKFSGPCWYSIEPGTDTFSVNFVNQGDLVQRVNHGLTNGSLISFNSVSQTTPATTDLPPINTQFYVVNVANDSFQISSSPGGSPVVFTRDGTGVFVRWTPIRFYAFDGNTTPSCPIEAFNGLSTDRSRAWQNKVLGLSCKVVNTGYSAFHYERRFGGRSALCGTSGYPSKCFVPRDYDYTDLDPNGLVPENIAAGVKIFGVSGTFGLEGSWGAGLAHPPGNNQLSLPLESSDLADVQSVGATVDQFKLLEIPVIQISDQDSSANVVTDEKSLVKNAPVISRVDPVSSWGNRGCGIGADFDSFVGSALGGTTSGSGSGSGSGGDVINPASVSRGLARRSSDCLRALGLSTRFDGSADGNAGQGLWTLIARSSTGLEVWQDQRTGLLWTSRLVDASNQPLSVNWCQASGNSATASCPPSSNSGQSLCSVDANAAKLFSKLTGTRNVEWRLPTLNDYEIALYNGLNFVLPDFATESAEEWTGTTRPGAGDNTEYALTISSRSLVHQSALKRGLRRVRCVGR